MCWLFGLPQKRPDPMGRPQDQGRLNELLYQSPAVAVGVPQHHVVIGLQICRKAQAILEKAIKTRTSEDRNFTLRSQIFRATALNLETLKEWAALKKHFADWENDFPNDPYLKKDYERLRFKIKH